MSVSVKITMQNDTDFNNVMLSISIPTQNMYKLLHMNKEQMLTLYIELNGAGYDSLMAWNEGEPHPKATTILDGEKITFEYGVWTMMLHVLGDWVDTLPLDEPSDDFMELD